jgi:hypothetical protein
MPTPQPQPEQYRTLAEVHRLVDEKRTTGNGWHLRATSYPTGDVEVMALKLGPEDRIRRGGGKRKNKEKQSMDEQNLRRSQRRSKQTVRRKCLTLQADTLLTLTYRENQTDLEQAWKHFQNFSKLMKQRYKHWQYICVPERQERGSIHFHLAIRGYYHWNTVRRFWWQTLGCSGEGQKPGNVDFQKRKDKKGRIVVDPSKISRYLAKYLSKQETVEFNKRRYSSSKITLPAPIRGWLALGVSPGQIMRQICERITSKRSFHYYEIDGYYQCRFIAT